MRKSPIILAAVACGCALFVNAQADAGNVTHNDAGIDAPGYPPINNTVGNATAGSVANGTAAALAIPPEVAAANNGFALDFYRQVSDHGGNIFFSPTSIYAAFSMVYEAAGNDTAAQMQEAFGFEPDESLRHNHTAALASSLNRPDPNATLTLANSLWLADWFEPYDSYLNVIGSVYAADITSVNFTDSETVEAINAWAAEKTQDKIPRVIGPSDVHDKTSSVLMNAIYFKGSWEHQFEPEYTSEMDFWTGSENVTAHYMTTQNHFEYAVRDGAQFLRLPYEGDRLSMLVILPLEKDGLDYMLGNVTAGQVDQWAGEMYQTDVIVYMPKFEVRTHYNLVQHLKYMGVTDLFDPFASDLSGMAELEPPERLWVEKALHDAYVKVNEEGTEAAAVTTIIGGMIDSVPPPPEVFKADHPFLFVIQDDESGTILFMGRVSDPSCTIYNNTINECAEEYTGQ